ncbi:protein TIFY 5A-like [Bidens hawaiensis]|uniref:protein TIFY 5A-like n=1 Tax=Bidens hawaiensis TaxID=980011 RepID=UPI004048F7E8
MSNRCNLELRLVPSSPTHLRQDNPSYDINIVSGEDLMEKQKYQQQLTIFYDGKVSVCDVTELQARTIIKLASEEMDEKCRRRPPPGSTTCEPSSSPLMPGGLSMKRSLQRFLQKRQHRIQETSPYHPYP